MTTLLAVDDSSTMRKVLEITFASEPYETVLATSADDALSKLGQQHVEVALIDITLGAEDGYQLCQKVKAEFPRTRVVLLSSKQQGYDATRGGEVGADDHIDKPFETQALLDKVAAVLEAPALEVPVPEAPVPAPQRVPEPAMTAPAPAPISSHKPWAPASNPIPSLNLAPRPAAAAEPASAPGYSAAGYGAAGHGAAGHSSPAYDAPAQSAPEPVAAPAAISIPSRPQPNAASGHHHPQTKPAPSALASSPAVLPTLGGLETRLEALGLGKTQIEGVLALSKEIVEQAVWEVVPTLAETLIKEEIARLTKA